MRSGTRFNEVVYANSGDTNASSVFARERTLSAQLDEWKVTGGLHVR